MTKHQKDAQAVAEQNGFVVEFILDDTICWRYNSHNPKNYDDLKRFVEVWRKSPPSTFKANK